MPGFAWPLTKDLLAYVLPSISALSPHPPLTFLNYVLINILDSDRLCDSDIVESGLLVVVFMPQLFSAPGQPLNCQCSYSHLRLLAPATLLRILVVGCVYCMFV